MNEATSLRLAILAALGGGLGAAAFSAAGCSDEVTVGQSGAGSTGGTTSATSSGAGGAGGGGTTTTTTTTGAGGGPPTCPNGNPTQQCYTLEQLEWMINNPPMGGDVGDAGPDGGVKLTECPEHGLVQNDCCVPAAAGPVLQGDDCCYWFCESGCCGRPFVVGDRALVAPPLRRDDWLAEPFAPSDAALDPVTRAALHAGWLRDAQMEHASIASFARFTLELLGLGAPPELLADAQRAALDEIEHARLCFTLAAGFGRDEVGPAPLDVSAATRSLRLAESVAAAVREGCIGETIAALVAREQLAATEDPAVKSALLRIAADEERHAALAYRFVRWGIEAGGAPVREAARRALDDGLRAARNAPIDVPAGVDEPAFRRFGRLDRRTLAAVTRAALDEVITPLRRGRPERVMSRPLRIGYGRIFHEACGDSPLPSDVDAFERLHWKRGEELHHATTLRGVELLAMMPHAELTGFRQAARLAGKVETVPLFSALSVPGGPLTAQAFEIVLGELLRELRAAGPLDGVYLALHGSMEVQGSDEAPEGRILRAVRSLVGPRTPIAASYDLHANLTSGHLDEASIVVGYRSNPHWDLAPTGFRAGRRLIAALRGEISPVMAYRKLPMVLGAGNNLSMTQPLRGLLRKARELESRRGVVTVNLFTVHPFLSRHDVGWSTQVTTNGDRALAERLAEELADEAWSVRRHPMMAAIDIHEAFDRVERSPFRRLGPVTLVDGDDIVGAGAPGGNTRFVKTYLDEGRSLRGFVTVHDPAMLDELWDSAKGARFDGVLRGTPGYGCPEVPVSGTVIARASNELGRRVRLDLGALSLVVSSSPPLPIHPRYFEELGLSVREADFIVQKNFFHYRMFYLRHTFEHLLVKSDGATSFDRVRARRFSVPRYPQDDPAGWREGDRLLRAMR
jgi:microcystin degradation protein MlrC